MASVANRAHCRRNLRRKKEKGGRGGNRLKGWMLAVPRCSGGFRFRTFWDRWATTAGRHEGAAAGKAVPFPHAARRSQVLRLGGVTLPPPTVLMAGGGS